MKTPRLLLLVLFLPALALAQRSDLVSPHKRAEIVTLAQSLLKAPDAPAVAADAPSPFAPPTFDQPDPEEIRAQQAAAAAAAAANALSKPMGARAVLEDLASRITPSGIARLGGESILLFGQKKLKVGDRLTITFEGTDYDLDITAIGSTTFTLRYNGEEITRSIKSGKSP